MDTEKVLKKIKKNVWIYKHILILAGILLLYITFCKYTYGQYIRENVIDIYDNDLNQVIGEISNNDKIVQKFKYGNKQIDGVEIKTATYGEKSAGSGILSVELIEGNTKKVLAKTECKMNEIKDNSYKKIYFDKPIYVEGKNDFELSITTRGMKRDDKFTLWLANTDTAALYNGELQKGGILLSIDTSESDYFVKMCLFAAFIVGIVIGVSYVLIFIIKYKKIHNYFLVYAVLLGGLYFVFIPEYETPDEPRHMQSAYSLSNIFLGYGGSDDGILMRQSDFEAKHFCTKYTRRGYNEYVRQILCPDEVNENMVNIGLKPLNEKKYLYLFPALGITLGRILHLGTVQTFLLGSIFNYIMFVLAVYFSIKKIPVCKTALLLISILPMTLQLATSYSYDCGIIALGTLMTAYALKIAYDDKVSRADVVVLSAATILYAPVKTGAYMMMCMIVLLPIVKQWKKNKIIPRVLLGILVIRFVMVFISTFIVSGNQIEGSISAGYIEWAGEEGHSLSALISNPWQCVVIFWETIMSKLSFYIQTIIGGNLGWFQISMQWFIVIGLLMAILVAAVKKKNDTIQMSKKTRTLIAAICILTAGFITAAMLIGWTPKSYNFVEGVQGRYFLPFFILILMIFRGDWIKAEERADGYCMYFTILLQPLIYYSLICSF